MPLRWIPVVLALAWGLNWPAVKIILGTVPPFLARGIGLGGGVLVLFALAAWQGRDLRPRRADAIPILIGGGFTVALFNFATAFAQLNTSTSRAAPSHGPRSPDPASCRPFDAIRRCSG